VRHAIKGNKGIISMVAQSIVEVVRRYAEVLRDHFPIKRVILYGSFARGTQRSDSDIDVAVLLKIPPEDFLSAETEMFKLCREIDLRIEPKLIDDEYDPSGFYEDISKYGTVVFSGDPAVL
jgi:predicted nucleotidyltransferase